MQGFAKLRRKQDGRARDGNDVRDRLGQIHGRRLVGQQRRQQIDQRQEQFAAQMSAGLAPDALETFQRCLTAFAQNLDRMANREES